MLIELTNLQSIQSPEQRRAFSRLLQSHDDGNHFVFINQPPEELNDINLEYLNQFEQNAYFTIKENYTTQCQLLSELCMHIKVDFSTTTNSTVYEPNSGVIRACYTMFVNSNANQATKLVLEDEDDSSLYKEITMIMNKSTLGTPDAISYDAVHGGGSRTAREFRSKRDEGYITLCIVDSDKPHPNKGIGDTASALRQEITDGVSGLSHVKLLDVHEVENLVPIELLGEVTRQHYRNNGTFFDSLRALLEQHNELHKYIDLKSGLTVEKAFELDFLYGEFWLRNSITSTLLHNGCRQCLNRAKDSGEFDCDSEEPCSFLKSYNDNLLGHATTLLKSTSPKRAFQSLEGREKNLWHDIADLITAWCFSNPVGSSI